MRRWAASLAIARGLEGGELRIEGDEREDEGVSRVVCRTRAWQLWFGVQTVVGVSRAQAGTRAGLGREFVGLGDGTWPSVHGHSSLRAATTCWTEMVAWPAAAAQPSALSASPRWRGGCRGRSRTARRMSSSTGAQAAQATAPRWATHCASSELLAGQQAEQRVVDDATAIASWSARASSERNGSARR